MSYTDSRSKIKIIASTALFFMFIALAGFVYLISNNRISIAYNTNYAPDQPIPFSHKLHVGDYQMDCRYCHTSVEESPVSSVPSLDICMNCHLTVKPNSPWIQKIRKAYEENKTIAWQKVHLLPDFVKFNHSLHIKALSAKSETSFSLPLSTETVRKTCTLCHGKVENMEIMYQHSPLSMGWCLQCHRKEENQAPINCSTCHY